jgi:hypothetical protein
MSKLFPEWDDLTPEQQRLSLDNVAKQKATVAKRMDEMHLVEMEALIETLEATLKESVELRQLLGTTPLPEAYVNSKGRSIIDDLKLAYREYSTRRKAHIGHNN